MDALILGLAMVVLVGAGVVFRRVPRKGRVRGAVAFVAGLMVAALGVKALSHHLHLYPDTDYTRVASDVLTRADARSLVLFVGTSMSRNGLDDVHLTQALNALGWHVTALNLSLHGASLQERERHLEQVLRALPKPPAAVFIEIARPTEDTPTYPFWIGKFSDRVIGQFGPEATFVTARALLSDHDMSLPQKAVDGALVGTHFGLNLLNVGQLRGSNQWRSAEPLRAFEPIEEPWDPPSLAVTLAGLSQRSQAGDVIIESWIQERRAVLRQRLKDQGVGLVGFYMPPVISPDDRAYGEAVCRSQNTAICISPRDDALLAALSRPVWADESHLMQDGARIYTDWLARELARGFKAFEDQLEDTAPDALVIAQLRRVTP